MDPVFQPAPVGDTYYQEKVVVEAGYASPDHTGIRIIDCAVSSLFNPSWEVGMASNAVNGSLEWIFIRSDVTKYITSGGSQPSSAMTSQSILRRADLNLYPQ